LLGITAQLTGKSLDGVFSLVILFLIGSVLLFFVKIPEKKGLENEG
jgi:transporter